MRPEKSKINNRKSAIENSFLPGQLQCKLQLSWIECRGRLLAAIPQWVNIRNIKAVYKIERVHQPFQRHTLAQWDSLADPNVSENVHGLSSGIATQVSIQGSIQEACGLQESGWRKT